jgi:hypothetical protein
MRQVIHVAELGEAETPSPELRSWIERIIVPALVSEWIAEQEQKNLANRQSEVTQSVPATADQEVAK